MNNMIEYRLTAITGTTATLEPLYGGDPLTVKDAWRVAWLSSRTEKIICHNGVRWSTRSRSHHEIRPYTPNTNPQPQQTQYTLPEEKPKMEFSPVLLEDITEIPADNLRFGNSLDHLFSAAGGITPATSVMITGEPGVGKSTVLIDAIANLNSNGHKALFISAEMGRADMARYLKRFPNWKTVPTLFLQEHAADDNGVAALEGVLAQGWDCVLIDSYTELGDVLSEELRLSSRAAEKHFLDLVRKHSELADNEAGKYTCFITILQLTKGGQFVGSNKLKHMTTSMAHMGWEDGKRYIEFSKNRVGQVGRKLYYEMPKTGGLTFDETGWETATIVDETMEKINDIAREEEGEFLSFLQELGENGYNTVVTESEEDGDEINFLEDTDVDLD